MGIKVEQRRQRVAVEVLDLYDGAVRIAVSSWNRQAWTDLAKNISR
ncbi:MAG: hypothetical protein ACE5GT_01720 [Rhodospirillales bacterium]